jgi:benzoyl-CoA reductase/2-hydroxyglutaryl-CoA dehydratase subunit BcrC/BadD/HgdB
MVSEQHIKMWESLDINTELLSKMVSAAVKRHEDVFKTQSNRPSSMDYFDNFWANLQTGRVEELQEVKKAKKPLVGTFCIFVPEESVTALGGACYGLCSGSPASIPEAEKELPRNICPLIKSAHGFKLLKACGYTQSADFIYGETTCEAKKKTWEILAKHHPVHVMQIPQKKDKKSLELWKKEIEEFNEHIEEVSGEELTFEKLKDGIETVNSKRDALNRLDKLRSFYPDVMPISGKDALLVMQISFVDEPKRFTQKLHELCDELEARVEQKVSVFEKDAPRLIILGTPFAAPNWKLHDIVETSGAAIINEESCIGHRYYKDNIDTNGATTKEELVDNMLERYADIDCACFTPNEARIDKIKKMIEDRKADGVIYYTLAFCHTYNVESFLVSSALKEAGVPFLAIESDYSPEDAGQIKTRIEAFLESIKNKKVG